MEHITNNLLGISMGCPVGIGPEVIVKAFSEIIALNRFIPVVFGDISVIKRCVSALEINTQIAAWLPGNPPESDVLHVCHVPDLVGQDISFAEGELAWGHPNRKTGSAMASYIEQTYKALREKKIVGMVTCPITKLTLNEAGYDFPGHTEMLASLCGSSDYAMMMAGKSLKVTLVTIHKALSEVPKILSRESIAHLIDLTGRSLRNDFGIKMPRIGVAGLNPHAGEGGMFGDEEIRLIAPAILKSQELGWQVKGPFPPDTIFNQAVHGEFDAMVCMYHDQGLIPFKLLHFDDGVNVTIGLPIVRTSVDHGTAYNIAGQGIANPESLTAAFQLAGIMVENRRKIEN